MMTFNDVTIRGRFAYAACLFEKLLRKKLIFNLDWEWLIEKMWSFAKMEIIDEWLYEFSEYLPDCVLESSDYEKLNSSEPFEYLNEEYFYKLYNLYKNANPYILEIINIIFDIGTHDLYSRFINHSPETLMYLKNIISILKRNEVEIIDVNPFLRFLFKDTNGYGEPFKEEDIIALRKLTI